MIANLSRLGNINNASAPGCLIHSTGLLEERARDNKYVFQQRWVNEEECLIFPETDGLLFGH